MTEPDARSSPESVAPQVRGEYDSLVWRSLLVPYRRADRGTRVMIDGRTAR